MSVKSELESLANAIRSKTGGSELLTIPGMAAAVDGLSVGGGGGEEAFYMATSYQGVLTEIEVTAGNVESYMYEFPVSLVGVYTLVDPSASGTDRKWVCNATIAGEDQESDKVYLRTFDSWAGFDDNDNDIYEKRWGFTTYDGSDAESSLIYSDAYTGGSPFSVTGYETGMDTGGFVKPVFAPAVDEPPYGATAWNGKLMTWQEREIYITYGNDCLPSCVGYWVRQDSGEITVNSTWVNLTSGAVIKINKRSNEYRSWEFHAYLDYYKGVGKVYGGGNFIETGIIPSPFSMNYSASLFNVMPQGTLYTVEGNEGWYPADVETTGLEIKKNAPKLGKAYNKDATVLIGAMYPAK